MNKRKHLANEIAAEPSMSQSRRRKFVGFTSTQAPQPNTRHQYENVSGTFFVRHRDLDSELQIVFSILQQEARINRQWRRWSVQKAILRQFIADSTHLMFDF